MHTRIFSIFVYTFLQNKRIFSLEENKVKLPRTAAGYNAAPKKPGRMQSCRYLIYNQIMHRFYLSQQETNGELTLSDTDQLHHLKDVLRLKAGDEVEVFDGRGGEYLCHIRSIEPTKVVLHVKSARTVPLSGFKLAIGCAVPKNVKMDDIVDKLTQLGVDVIVPLRTERVVVKLEENSEAKLHRWRKIALSAARQSGRPVLPEVADVMKLPEFLSLARDYETRLIPTLAGTRTRFQDALKSSRGGGLAVLIGPEGDFTPGEIAQALSAGFVPVSLGDLVLRVDTAAVAVAACVRLGRSF
jgi:16S rRNA (uracil1498-N3)-methyltransferase